MKINYNVKGTERKELVTAISQELNAPIKYLGMPTAAYEVGGYTIDRNGTVTGEDNLELVDDIFLSHSFKAESEEYDTLLPETDEAPAFESLTMTAEEELGLGRQRRDFPGEDGMQASDVPEPDYDEETPDLDQHHPGRYADPNEPPTEEMLKQAAAWMEGQPEYEYESRHYRIELSDPDSSERMEVFTADNDEDAIRQAFEYATNGVVLLELHELDEEYNEVRTVDIPHRADRLAIEMPKVGFTDTEIANLRKLVESKTALIQKAVGADSLPIEETDNMLRFPWFSPDTSPDIKTAV